LACTVVMGELRAALEVRTVLLIGGGGGRHYCV
jgi:hypothetical protein